MGHTNVVTKPMKIETETRLMVPRATQSLQELKGQGGCSPGAHTGILCPVLRQGEELAVAVRMTLLLLWAVPQLL